MVKNDEQSIQVLNTLIGAGSDAERGFLAAADAVAEPELVQLFADAALQRTKFVQELADRIRTLRGTPEKSGTMAGELHRAWTGLAAAIASNESHAVLSECERGEDMAVMAYRAALGHRDIDAQTRDLIQRHYEQVQATHDRVRQLRDSPTYAQR